MRLPGILCVLILIAISCKKKHPFISDSADCTSESKVSADFFMEEMTESNLNFARYTNTDTIYANKTVRFTATEENAEYTWIIGSETLHEKEIFRFFSDQLIGQTIPVQLIVEKTPNLNCFPDDNGLDTVIKYLTIVEMNRDPVYHSIFNADQPNFDGTYRVKEQNGSDSVDVTFDFVHSYPGIPNYDFVIMNCTEDDALNKYGLLEGINYRQLWFKPVNHNGVSCYTTSSYLKIYSKNLVEFKFISTGSSTCENLIYKGRKL